MKILFSIILFMFFGFSASSQKKSNSKRMLTYDEKLYSSIKYRLVGPFRGGRAGTVAGVISYLAFIARFGAIFGGFGGGDRDGNNIISLLVVSKCIILGLSKKEATLFYTSCIGRIH